MKWFVVFTGFFLVLSQHSAAQKIDWAKGIGGSATDYISSIAQDATGNIYIAGYFQGTADFDPGPGVSALTSSGGNNIFFAKYDNDGNYLWAKRIGGAVHDVAYSVRVAASGNIYISGYFSSSSVDFDPGPGVANLSSTSSSYDMFIAKYDQDGNYIWAKKMGGIGADNAWALQLDNAENLYISGYFWATVDFDPGPAVANLTSAGNYDIYMAKYDSGGNYIWAKRMGGSADDKCYAVDIDASGDIVITGAFQGTVDFDPGPGTSNRTAAGSYDIFLAKYDNNGNFLWANPTGSTGDDKSSRIAIDVVNNIYITGSFQNTVDFDPGATVTNVTSNGGYDMFLAKYDPAGAFVWVKGIGGPAADQAHGVCFDDSSNVYMTGRFSNTADFNPGFAPANLTSVGVGDVFVAKYMPSGAYQFAFRVGGQGDDIAVPIYVDGQSAIYVAGAFTFTSDFDPDPIDSLVLTSTGATDAFIAKYLQCFSADPPVVTASSIEICTGDADTLKVVGGILNKALYWQWYKDSCGGSPIDTGFSIVVFPHEDMIYYVRGEGGCAEPGPCTAISTKVNPIPKVTAMTTERLCIGSSIELFAYSLDSIVAWQWYGPGGFLAYAQDTVVANATLGNAGQYVVFGIDTNGCISMPVIKDVLVQPFPTVKISNNDTTIMYGDDVRLNVQGADFYSWTPVRSLSHPFVSNPLASPKEPTLYLVTGTDSIGCSNTDSVFVDIKFDDNLFVPSAFSPNNDGRNDVFRVVNLSFQRLTEFRVFNRWGQEIFSTTNPNVGWDGRFNGQPQEAGVYYYLIRVAVPDGSTKVFKGDVALVR